MHPQAATKTISASGRWKRELGGRVHRYQFGRCWWSSSSASAFVRRWSTVYLHPEDNVHSMDSILLHTTEYECNKSVVAWSRRPKHFLVCPLRQCMYSMVIEFDLPLHRAANFSHFLVELWGRPADEGCDATTNIIQSNLSSVSVHFYPCLLWDGKLTVN